MSLLKSIFVLSIISVFLTTCSNEPTPAPLPASTLIAPIENWELEELAVFNIENEISETFSPTVDTVRFSTEEAMMLDLKHGRQHHYVYIGAGEQLTLDTVSTNPLRIVPTGERSPENAYLLDFADRAAAANETYSIMEYGEQEPAEFLTTVKAKYSSLDTLLQAITADETVTDDFKKALATRLLAAKGNELLEYKYVFEYLQKKAPELPADFYDLLEGADFADPTTLWFESSRSFANSWQSRTVEYGDYEASSDYFAALLDKTKNAYDGSLVGAYCQFETLKEYINFGGGIDKAGEAINNFQKNVGNSYLQAELEATVTPWLALKSGEVAPDFTVQNRVGESVQLSDLQGKKVYIDVWATWCGPCIREIPALKVLETDLHEENIEFVSVSIDRNEDRQKWLDFIEEKELKGVQLMADGAWKSDVVEAYNIGGIPRFLLIDAQGKIISADAPRPSDPTIREILMD